MNINGHTHIYGVLGHPVDHSLSPLIHNAAFSQLQMNAVYLAFHVQPEALCLAFEGLRSLEIRGANLTIPFKEVAIEFIDEIPEDVDRATGAINTVVNKKGQLHGYNTDGPGFLRALREELSFNPEGKNILVLGAGGAARSVVFALSRAHAQRIFIHNRTRERAQGLAEVSAPFFPETELEPVISLDELRLQKVDLVVNATSCGMKGNQDIPFDLKQLKKKAAVYDLVYSPLETPFLRSARALGWSAANGLHMLAEQAALSFELWTGKKEGVREAMLGALKTCSL
jgi:shikimate dehydrogenase